MEFITDPDIVQGETPYSPGVKAGDFIFVSATPPTPRTDPEVDVSVQEQTRETLGDIETVLEQKNSCLKDIVKVTVYLRNLEDFNAINDPWKEVFEPPYPHRNVLEVSDIPFGGDLELEAVAYVG